MEIISSEIFCDKSHSYKMDFEVENSCTFLDVDSLNKILETKKINLLGKQILFFSEKYQCYCLAGIFRENNNIQIPIYGNKMSIKYRKVSAYIPTETSKIIGRGNERTIKEAIMLVTKWMDQQNKLGGRKYYSLKQSANDLKIPKKTLDEYFRQIKFGLKYNFDFNYYKECPIGMLRQFNISNLREKNNS